MRALLLNVSNNLVTSKSNFRILPRGPDPLIRSFEMSGVLSPIMMVNNY